MVNMHKIIIATIQLWGNRHPEWFCIWYFLKLSSIFSKYLLMIQIATNVKL